MWVSQFGISIIAPTARPRPVYTVLACALNIVANYGNSQPAYETGPSNTFINY